MTLATQPQLLTFEEFLVWKPEGRRFELIDGVAIEMPPTGGHENITEFLSTQLILAVAQANLPYRFPRQALIKAWDWNTGFLPDVLVVDAQALQQEERWAKEATICSGATVKLAIEVVSTNWENDYARKTEDYAEMGITEYWIVDYLGLGGKAYIGDPKQPTISVYILDRQRLRYQAPQLLHSGDIVQSVTFPGLALAVDQIFGAAE
jgi:Uma2 family endonuclease